MGYDDDDDERSRHSTQRKSMNTPTQARASRAVENCRAASISKGPRPTCEHTGGSEMGIGGNVSMDYSRMW